MRALGSFCLVSQSCFPSLAAITTLIQIDSSIVPFLTSGVIQVPHWLSEYTGSDVIDMLEMIFVIMSLNYSIHCAHITSLVIFY